MHFRYYRYFTLKNWSWNFIDFVFDLLALQMCSSLFLPNTVSSSGTAADKAFTKENSEILEFVHTTLVWDIQNNYFFDWPQERLLWQNYEKGWAWTPSLAGNKLYPFHGKQILTVLGKLCLYKYDKKWIKGYRHPFFVFESTVISVPFKVTKLK